VRTTKKDWAVVDGDFEKAWEGIKDLFPLYPPHNTPHNRRLSDNRTVFRTFLWVLLADKPVRRIKGRDLAMSGTLHRALSRWVWERRLDRMWKAYLGKCSPAALRVWERALLSEPERRAGDRGSQRRNTYWYCVPRFILQDKVDARNPAAGRKRKAAKVVTPKGRKRSGR
jgi:hypothetical protein